MNFKIAGFVTTFLLVVALCPIVNGQAPMTIGIDAPGGPSVNASVGIGTDERITLTAFGADLISNLTFIADTGPAGPAVVSLTGEGFLAGNTPAFAAGAGLGNQAISATFLGPPTAVSIPGQDFISVGFDTSALAVGSVFDVNLSVPAGFTPGGFNTFFNDNAGTDREVDPGTFTVTVEGAAVPEPSSAIVLLATGGLALLRRKRS